MYYKEFAGINSFLIGMSKALLEESVTRHTRGFKCYELPNPIIIKIINPTSRLISIPEREWNYILPYVESLWLASGRNDMDMVGHYVKKLYDFSDDSETMRAGYGPRLRWFNGVADDYNTGYHHQPETFDNKVVTEVDQFKFVEQSFNNDAYTRQAIVSLADPAKDCFDKNYSLKRTKDFPCTRDIQFLRNKDKLDVIVHMRSNDFLWGASGVNIFNFTFMQEYFAQILGLKVGCYYHIVNNFHYYENFKDKLESFAAVKEVNDEVFTYDKKFNNLKEFDERISALQTFEKRLRDDVETNLPEFEDDFFNDWAKVLYSFHSPKVKIKFLNPVLDSLAEKKLTLKVIKGNKLDFDKTFTNQGDIKTTYWQNFI